MGERPGSEGEALDRLETDDAALERVLDEVRREAEALVAGARAAAEREAADARRALEAELEGLRAAAAREAAEHEAGVEARARERAATLRAAAGGRREAAIATVLARVAGEAAG